MRKITPFLLRLPEPLLILGTIYSWVLTGTLVNLLPVCIILLLFALIFTRAKWLGQFTALLLVFVSIYFMLAVVSEYSDYPAATPTAYRLLFFGLSFFGLGLCVATIMVWKYFK